MLVDLMQDLRPKIFASISLGSGSQNPCRFLEEAPLLDFAPLTSLSSKPSLRQSHQIELNFTHQSAQETVRAKVHQHFREDST